MKKLIWMVVFLSGECWAGDWRLNINLASKHFSDPPEGIESYNEKNYGVGAEYHTDDDVTYLSAGAFRNSFDMTSYYIGIGVKISSSTYNNTGIEFALSNGYKLEEIQNDVRPVLSVYWKPKISDRVAMKINYTKQILFLQYQYDI